MCGIAGFVGALAPPERCAANLAAMCDAIRHRGPDDAGYFIQPGVALGMRRLSIIDIPGGHQPIGNEDGAIQVVFNGEIYNYRELRSELQREGHRFTTQGDTETIVHLFEDEADRLVHRLRGMFAFALWDTRRRRLLLARDRLGIKPLYYWASGGRLAFASELKALLALPDMPRAVNRSALADYLALGYVPEPNCILQGVHKLPPGHLLTWQADGDLEVTRYWSPFRLEDTTLDEHVAVEELRRLLTESIAYRLIADVPLGAFLSGGLDSSAVVAEMSRQMDRPVQTFSVGFDEPDFSEAPQAAAVARALRTDHSELIVRPEVDALFEAVVAAFDEPFADSSAIPTFLVSQLARSRVTVALSGDGGDELFGGYTRYADLMRRDVPLPRAVRMGLGIIGRKIPQGSYGRNRLLELSRRTRGRYAGMVADPLAPIEGGVARSEVVAAGLDSEELLARWYVDVPERDPATMASFVDLISYLPGDILTKVDRMSMAVSLEARVPLLDHPIVEFATSLPARLRFHDGQVKWIWRKAIRGLVPDHVLDRPKQGFAIPLRHWFRRELRYRVEGLLRADARIYEFVALKPVRRVIQEHLAGRRDHSHLIWKLLVLGVFLDNLADPRRTPPAPGLLESA